SGGPKCHDTYSPQSNQTTRRPVAWFSRRNEAARSSMSNEPRVCRQPTRAEPSVDDPTQMIQMTTAPAHPLASIAARATAGALARSGPRSTRTDGEKNGTSRITRNDATARKRHTAQYG